MLGHLVVGRYGSQTEAHILPSRDSSWMTRMFRALFRKKS